MTTVEQPISSRVPLRLIVALLFLGSGFTGLVYEVLWLKELRFIFGNTAQAAAATLAAFFLGIAAGGWFWGRRSPGLSSPLRAYAGLEAAIAASAIPYLGLRELFELLYEPLYSTVGASPILLTTAKFSLAMAVLVPPAFFMGGTLPVMGQFLVRKPEELARIGSFLYACNTLGATLGAFAAGFYLPRLFGFDGSYALAIALNLLIAAATIALARAVTPSAAPPRPPKAKKRRPADFSPAIPAPAFFAFLSGALTLGLEVLWTRMFSQVLQNSVYTFSAVLVIFLLSLSVGAWIANRLCAAQLDPKTAFSLLLTAAGLAVGLSPFWFMDVTNGMRYLGSGLDWGPYVVTIFTRTSLTLLLPGALIGTILPYLLRLVQGAGAPGALLGRMTAWNTLGSVAGSIGAGFLLLPSIGLWGGLRLAALAYLLLAITVATGGSRAAWAVRAAPAAVILLFFTVFDATQLPIVRIDPANERLLGAWQGGHGVVAVVERNSGSRRIKVNNFYRLGSSAAIEHERNQALIPLMPHPRPERVFFLGMGTGITAGAAVIVPGVERIVVCELVPEVVDAGAFFFNEPANGLFHDPRVQILRTDGRNHLRGSREQYDAILADLFIPWKEGSGSLYSLEHFQAVSKRLRPGGIFVQWAPMYQVAREEFEIIARTLLEVFPEVVVWRGDFYPEKPILALVASHEPLQLDPEVIVARGRRMAGNNALPAEAVEAVTLPFYAGNLGRSRHLIPDGSLNTDRRPIIEYGAPITHRNARSGDGDWFVGVELEEFILQLAAATPPENDPYLERLNPRQLGYVEAGLSYYRAAVAEREGDQEAARRYRADFSSKIPIDLRPDTDDAQVGVEVGE